MIWYYIMISWLLKYLLIWKCCKPDLMNSMRSKKAVGNAFSSHQDLASFPINCRSSWKKCFKSNQRSVRVLVVHWWSGASTGLMPHSLTTAASPHLLGCCYNEVMSKSSFPTTPVLLRGPIQAIWNKNDLMSHSLTAAALTSNSLTLTTPHQSVFLLPQMRRHP